MAKLSVSGKIIQEVSHSVPGTKYAIIELIKNAYEARAKKVSIRVSEEEIIIEDDGKGMNSEEIETLLTVSDSDKEFGQEIDGRLISGEKGLGFFSSFKFGNKIEVSTCKDGIKSIFSLDMKEIGKQKNLYHLDIPVEEKNYDDLNIKGTTIVIRDLNAENFTLFKDKLDDESEFCRLCNVIEDPEFNIEVKTSWGKNVSDKSEELDIDRMKIVTAEFDSKKMIDSKNRKYFMKLIRNNNAYQINIEDKYSALFEKKEFELRINIDIFNFRGTNKNVVSKLYHDNPRNRIVPIIYINNSLFDNYTMYNPDINARKNNSIVFRQQAGKIELILRSPGIISFNADRTQMTESANSKLFQEFLDYFSSTIQIKLRDILNEEEEKKPKVVRRESFVGKTPDLKNEEYEIVSIMNNGEKKSQIDNSKKGTWEVTYKNGDKIIISIAERPDPTIKQIATTFIVGRAYSFDELFTFRDCEKGTQIEPQEFVVTPENNRSINSEEMIITFNKPCEKINFSIKIRDKISGKVIHGEYISKVIFPKSSPINNGQQLVPVIHPIMEINQNVKQDVIDFKNQLNDLYREEKYEIVFISALRTFIELVVNDIVSKLGEIPQEKLSQNYNLINKEEHVKNKFLEAIPDGREKSGVKAIYKQAIDDGRYNSTIRYLNLSTHAAQRIITLKQLESDFPIINFLYTYLCFLNN
ncbi:ATP-binding protein [Listeria seeligeri]|uniref:ATP-binding protein n=1 Tax=Listeria seeligeri TaxID=1640 RepID=UPI001625B572|nr:ATP-binding protein [Listeria seeligeri]MBC1481146.1 hypothetical protein [Listeria seeligeri]MBC1720582.1 hypothetical protein [Listeria seeligeri]MBC1790534.1 hypothetical protein [Listeria seeligeri]MBC1847180.1 hypothetical protein [Listeria seeligeri]MBC1857802.1 hypothetical protein [Listeria seeligeri]